MTKELWTIILGLFWRVALHAKSPTADAFQPLRVQRAFQTKDRRKAQKEVNSQQQQPSGRTPNIHPLSRNPPLWVTLEPLLTPDECHQLTRHFVEGPDDQSQQTLEVLQEQLDRLICRPVGAPRVIPRFLNYNDYDDEEEYPTTPSNIDSVNTLLPDGLHVDTSDDGGDSSRRYLTAIVYLTGDHTTSSAATTFPLAIPLGCVKESTVSTFDPAFQAAQSLLDANVLHTQCCVRDEEERLAMVLEQVAWKVYQQQQHQQQVPTTTTMTMGLRILPRQGHCVIFNFIQPASGRVDPRSWHSSETLVQGQEKRVLTFFYEILDDTSPLPSSTPRHEFGQHVQNALEPLLDR